MGLAYLLCRVVDTIEDSEKLEPQLRERLFDEFRRALLDPNDALAFTGHCTELWSNQQGDEAALMAEAQDLFTYYFELPKVEREILQPWIDEMAEGMKRFAARKVDNLLMVLDDEEDLFRYCHYVAGTVGGLLTDLFILHESDINSQTRAGLEERAESFAQGLQQVNMAKDLAGDHLRGWQFLPRSFCVDFDPGELLQARVQRRVLDAHGRLCDLAEAELSRGLEYTLLLPPRSSARRFCTLPLLLARATFDLLRNNPDVLDPQKKVKIERSLTMELIQFTALNSDDDDAIKKRYRALGRV